MKLNLIFGMFTLFSWQFIFASESSVEQGGRLDISQRPARLKEHIDETFNHLSRQDEGCWRHTGSRKYFTMFVDDDNLVLKVVGESIGRKQERVIIMDVGAGDGLWGRERAKVINEKFPKVKEDLPNFQIDIVGLTGENYPSFSEKEELCTLHLIGAFKIEDLQQTLETHSEVKKKNLPFANNVDLIVSSLCFVHLHDPVGTYVQAYNLLRPFHGLIMTDGFPIYFDDDMFKGYSPEELKMVQHNMKVYFNQSKLLPSFLKALEEPFVLTTFDSGYASMGVINPTHENIYPFLVRRTKDMPARLPYQYADKIMEYRVNKGATYDVAMFHRGPSASNVEVLENQPREASIILVDSYNDRGLYAWLSTLGKRQGR